MTQYMLYQHVSCPIQYPTTAWKWLNSHYIRLWIGRGRPISWPVRSLDLTAINFYDWAQVKFLLTTSPLSQKELRQQLVH